LPETQDRIRLGVLASIFFTPNYSLIICPSTPLTQEDTRGQPNKPKVTCGMEVYANGGQRSTQRRLGKEVFSSTYTNLTELMLEGTLQPSDKPYTLLVTTFEPNVERRFDVKIFASEAVTVVPL
jgi:hypothetical protein